MKSQVSVLLFLLLFSVKVTGISYYFMDTCDIAICDSDTEEEAMAKDGNACDDSEEEETMDDLFHQKVLRLLFVSFSVRQKVNTLDAFVPSGCRSEVTSPPPEA
jgi:hypothetical protein